MGVEIVQKFSRFGLNILAKGRSFRGLKSFGVFLEFYTFDEQKIADSFFRQGAVW